MSNSSYGCEKIYLCLFFVQFEILLGIVDGIIIYVACNLNSQPMLIITMKIDGFIYTLRI